MRGGGFGAKLRGRRQIGCEEREQPGKRLGIVEWGHGLWGGPWCPGPLGWG